MLTREAMEVVPEKGISKPGTQSLGRSCPNKVCVNISRGGIGDGEQKSTLGKRNACARSGDKKTWFIQNMKGG